MFGSKLIKTAATLALLWALVGCSPKIVEKIVYQTRDSIVTETRIDTMTVTIDHTEYIRDWTGLQDTLVMQAENGAITSKSWIDTTHSVLAGSLETKPRTAQVAVPVTNTNEFHSKDSTAVVEIPVPYEVEKKVMPVWAYWSLIFNILLLAVAVIYIILRVKFKLKI